MVDTCPSVDKLQELLDSGDGINSTIEDHINRCQRCQKRLDILTHHPAMAIVSQRDSAWTESYSSNVIRHVSDALAADKRHGTVLANPTRPGIDEAGDHRTLEIAGYEILNRIGRGGSSDVYRAFHKQLRRVVALKIIRDRALLDQRSRFRREAEALAKLRHPGIIQIYESGEADGSIFMSLEYEAGGSLSQFLKGEPQAAVDSARFIASAANAIHAAHQAGLIHRDLKPGNLLMHPLSEGHGDVKLVQYTPKITDFGLVKEIAEESALTASRDVLGTPSYMAPEQVAGQSKLVGPGTDVYSLGTVLYEMLTGRPPFRAASAIDTVVQVRYDEPVPPSRLIRTVPPDLETVCLKCLEKEPGRRYTTAAELAEDLSRFVEGRPVKARPIRWPIRIGRWTRRNPRIAGLSAVVFILLTLLAVLGPVIAYQEASLRKHAEDAEVKALAQWDRADRNLLAANDAIWQSTMLKVAEFDRQTEADSGEQMLRMIESAMPVLEKAKAKDPDLPSHRQRWGMALYFHGRASRRAGNSKRAETDLREAASLFERLAIDRPDQTENGIMVALIQLEQAHLAVQRSQPDSESKIRIAVDRFEQMAKGFPQSPEVLTGLAEACRLLADQLDHQAGTQAEVTTLLRRVTALTKRITSTAIDRNQRQEAEVTAHLRLAIHLQRVHHSEEAELELRSACTVAQQKNRGVIPSQNLILLRSKAERMLADCIVDRSQVTEARQLAQSAERLATNLAELYPDDAGYKIQLLECKLTQASIALFDYKTTAAREYVDAATSLAKTLPLPLEIKERLETARTRALEQGQFPK